MRLIAAGLLGSIVAGVAGCLPPAEGPPPQGASAPAPRLTCPQIIDCAGACPDEACARACWEQGGAGDLERAFAVRTCANESGCGADSTCVASRCATPIQRCHEVPAQAAPSPAPPPVAGVKLPQVAPAGAPASPLAGHRWSAASSGAMGSGQATMRYEYDLRPDGTYGHRTEMFQSTHEVTVFLESGTWSATADTLTITPATTEGRVYHHGSQQLTRTFAVPREAVTYGYRMVFMSGLGEWNLLLRAPTPPQRDPAPQASGPYQGEILFGADKPLAWLTPAP